MLSFATSKHNHDNTYHSLLDAFCVVAMTLIFINFNYTTARSELALFAHSFSDSLRHQLPTSRAYRLLKENRACMYYNIIVGTYGYACLG
jgi:membrane-bound metal-dependent hydrolase YbcI (DUF457 family)